MAEQRPALRTSGPGGARFFAFLERAFQAIRVESPVAYASFVRELGPLVLYIEVDGEARWLSADSQPRLHAAPPRAVDAELCTERALIERLIDGERSLFEAMLHDELFVRGSTLSVAAAHDALIGFFRGAARAPSVPSLLDAYLERAPSSASR